MHCRDVKDIESIKKKTLTFHAGLGPKIHFGILTSNIKLKNLYGDHFVVSPGGKRDIGGGLSVCPSIRPSVCRPPG